MTAAATFVAWAALNPNPRGWTGSVTARRRAKRVRDWRSVRRSAVFLGPISVLKVTQAIDHKQLLFFLCV